MTRSRNLINKRWHPTATERQFLVDNFADMQTEVLARTFGVGYHQVCKLAKKLGLAKSAEFYASDDSGRLDGLKGSAHRFPKGHVPANKGKPNPGAGGATKFKPGRPAHEAHNYVPIGTEKVNQDGYLVRKITDDPTLAPVRRWESVHRLVWSEAHGPIPIRHMVAFKPGMHTTVSELITLDRLELVSQADWMKRHTFHQYGPEVAHAVVLRGAITRQINKRIKEQS